jgi:hypothetical protein
VAAENAPNTLTWSASASTNQNDAQAVQFMDTDISAFIGLLQSGQNLLAIHGLNVSQGSSDFLIDAELVVSERHIISEAPIAAVYTQPIPVTDLTTLKARAFSGGQWSALVEATFTVGQPRLVIY